MSQEQPKLSMVAIIQRCDATLSRKGEQLMEIAEQIFEVQKNEMQIVQFYEAQLKERVLQMKQLLDWGEAMDQLLIQLQSKVDFVIELPKRPEFITKNDTLPGKPSEKPQ